MNIKGTEYITNIPCGQLIGLTTEQYAEYLELKKEHIRTEKLKEKLKEDIEDGKQTFSLHMNGNHDYLYTARAKIAQGYLKELEG